MRLNKVFLAGNATRDGELSYTGGGSAVLNWGMAVNESYATRDGQERENTLFVDCALFGRRAEGLAQHITKGKPLFIEGKLKYDTWEDKKNGERRSKVSVIALNVEFMPEGERRGGEAQDDSAQRRESRPQHPAPGGQSFVSAPPPPNVPPAGPDLYGGEEEIPFALLIPIGMAIISMIGSSGMV